MDGFKSYCLGYPNLSTPDDPTVGAQHAVPAQDNAELIAKLRFWARVYDVSECLRAADALEAQDKRIADFESKLAKLDADFKENLVEGVRRLGCIQSLQSDLDAATARADFVSDCIITGADASTGQLFIESISRKNIVSGVTLGMHLSEWIAALAAKEDGNDTR